MINQTLLVGRIVRTPEVKQIDGSKISNLTIAVPRSYKNIDGEYETDYIDCTLWNGIAENTCHYCNKGDLIGVSGRLETNNYEKEGAKIYKTRVVAEKITFLSSLTNKDKNKELE